MKRSAVLLAVLALSAAALYSAPITGTFEEPIFLPGRWTESFIGGGPSQVGNIIEVASWDGATLGGQWELTGATLASPPLLVSDTSYGLLRVQQFLSIYDGAIVKLVAAGQPWDGGDGDYTVTVTAFTQSTILTSFKGVPLTLTAAMSMNGTVDGWSGYEMTYMVATTRVVDEGAGAPAGYRAIVSPAPFGQWGDANDTQMQIVPEPVSAALLLVGGAGLMFIRRRR